MFKLQEGHQNMQNYKSLFQQIFIHKTFTVCGRFIKVFYKMASVQDDHF